jgi:hypothetical protein
MHGTFNGTMGWCSSTPAKPLRRKGNKMSSKSELVGKITHLLLTEFEPIRVTAGDRDFLERSTVSYLENNLQELQNESVARGPVDPLSEALRE